MNEIHKKKNVKSYLLSFSRLYRRGLKVLTQFAMWHTLLFSRENGFILDHYLSVGPFSLTHFLTWLKRMTCYRNAMRHTIHAIPALFMLKPCIVSIDVVFHPIYRSRCHVFSFDDPIDKSL